MIPALDKIIALALEAGAAVLEVYRSDFKVEYKADFSPVTLADQRAEAIILKGLAQLCPEITVVSEEQVSDHGLPQWEGKDCFWLVDPLDGTKGFTEKRDDFTVNIGLVCHRCPVLGVVYAPALGKLYAGEVGRGAIFQQDGRKALPIRVRVSSPEGLDVVGSRHHGNPELMAKFLAPYKIRSEKKAGSSLKFCLLAAGEADLYPRFGPTHEWDTAAAHAILQAAGGRVTDLEGNALLYGKPGLKNGGFVAWAGVY